MELLDNCTHEINSTRVAKKFIFSYNGFLSNFVRGFFFNLVYKDIMCFLYVKNTYF
jgi:hypothetical protein